MSSRVKFIILEDNSNDRKLIERELLKFSENCQIRSSNTEEGFFELLNEFNPDIILSDYNLGSFTGMDILEPFKEMMPETPFIIVTGTLNEETAVDCLKQGAWDYVLKDKLYKLAPAIERSLNVKKDLIRKRQAEIKMQKSKERLRLVLDRNPIPIAVVDIEDDKIQYWSRSAKEMFGHDPKTTKEWYELAYPDPEYRKEVLSRWKPFLQKAKKTEAAINTGEYKISCKDGSIKICELYAQIIPDNLIVTLNDITERKHIENELRDRKEKLKLSMQAAKEGLWEWDLETNYMFFDDISLKMIGYKREDIKRDMKLGTWWIDQVHEEDRLSMTEKFESFISGRSDLYAAEFRMKNKDNQYVWIASNGEILSRTKAGEPKLVVGIHRNITEDKKRSAELKSLYKQAKFWSDVVESASIGVAIGFPDGSLGNSNKKYQEMTGYTHTELKSIDWNKVLTPPEWLDQEIEELNILYKTNKPVTYEKEYIRKNGERIPVELTVHPQLDEKNEVLYYYAFVTDITERKKQEAEFKKFEWLTEIEQKQKNTVEHIPDYGDVIALNTERTILDSVGEDLLKIIGADIMSLLDTSVAVYEKNGDYAFGMFVSGWCQTMDSASRKLCDTEDNKTALTCGKWLCHENCWNESALVAIKSGKPADIDCIGGIKLYAEPIYAGNEIVGVINIGYGNPPQDEKKLKELANDFNLDLAELKSIAKRYKPRPSFIEKVAKQHVKSAALLLGNMVLRRKMENEVKEHITELEIFNEASVDRELMINEHRKEINSLLQKLGKEPKYEIVE